MKTFKLHLIRHGITAGNLQGLYIGSGTDLPLCDEGRAQLADLKERFDYPQVDTVFSSPLLRAVETANILFPGAAHQFTVHDLREAGFGKFEGRPVKELVHDEDFKKWITPGSGYLPEGAEPTEQFHARCADSLLKLFEYMIRMDVTEAACVTHGGVIMSMLSQRAVPTRRPEQWMADPDRADRCAAVDAGQTGGGYRHRTLRLRRHPAGAGRSRGKRGLRINKGLQFPTAP